MSFPVRKQERVPKDRPLTSNKRQTGSRARYPRNSKRCRRYRQHACVLVKSVSTACWLWPLETSGSRINGRTVLQGVLGNRPLISAASWFLWTSVYDLRLVMVPEAGLNDNKKTEDNKTSSWNHKCLQKSLPRLEGPLTSLYTFNEEVIFPIVQCYLLKRPLLNRR